MITWEQAEALALGAIHDTDGRGMIGRSRNHLHERVARVIFRHANRQPEAVAGTTPFRILADEFDGEKAIQAITALNEAGWVIVQQIEGPQP